MEGKCVFKSSKYLNFPYCTSHNSVMKAYIYIYIYICGVCVCMCVHTRVHVCCVCTCVYMCAWECIYVYCFAQFLKLMNI